jgi:hypothetical protein
LIDHLQVQAAKSILDSPKQTGRESDAVCWPMLCISCRGISWWNQQSHLNRAYNMDAPPADGG